MPGAEYRRIDHPDPPVTAIQFDGMNSSDVIEFVAAVHPQASEGAVLDDKSLSMTTGEGPFIVEKGDYVIRDEHAAFTTCKPDVFVATHAAGVNTAAVPESCD